MEETPIERPDRMLEADLKEEMRTSFLDYSMSVIVSRALPDVRDGLKPVHRRILYTMYENGLTPDKAYVKSADTVGAVLGRYHPHGDASVYDAMVRMAQSFSLRYPLVDGHGNFGSVDGHPAAAYRYTEARMSRMAVDMLADIRKDTVDFLPNYDDRRKEPAVLPAKFPNLLVNGSSGIAVGMATNIPPHNLREVIDGICALIDDPNTDTYTLMNWIKGPDFPTGGIIMGQAGIRAAYMSGHGRIVVRARTEIEEESGSRPRLVITEIPYQVNKRALVKSIIDLADDKRIEGIRDVVDHSSREGMRVVIELDKTANPQVVLNQLFKFTQMQVTFSANMLVLVDGVPRVLGLKELLEEYIRFQCEVIERRTRFDLRAAKAEEHIQQALKTAVDFIDEVLAIIRGAADVPAAREGLAERFGFDEEQTDAIVKMPLGRLAGLERKKIEQRLGELTAIIADLEDILAHHERVLSLVKDECRRMQDKYGDDRRTEISPVDGEVDIEDLIPVENCVLTLTGMGYIKRQPADSYKSQRRGGRGVRGMSTRDEDMADTMLLSSTHNRIMFFSTAGRVYPLKCYEIPQGGKNAKGMNLVNLLPLQPDEKVTMMIDVPDSSEEEGRYLVMITANGVIKRTRLDAYRNTRKNGIIAIDLDEGDRLVQVLSTDGTETLLVGTRLGYAIRFNEDDARVVGRMARGVKALTLIPGDEVCDMQICPPDALVLTVAETGYGRITPASQYRVQSRGGKGLINYHTALYGAVAGVKVIDPSQDLILISSDGIMIRLPMREISRQSRTSKGVRVMKLEEGGKIVSMVTAAPEETPDSELP